MSRRKRGLENGFPFPVPGDWKVVKFSEHHYRINGVVDCWPGTGKWLPTGSAGKKRAESYESEKQLRHIVAQEEERAAKKKARAKAKLEKKLALHDARGPRREVEGVKTWDEFARRFN